MVNDPKDKKKNDTLLSEIDREFRDIGLVRAESAPGKGDDSVARVLDEEFSKLGYGSTQRLSLLGDIGRENAWNRKTIFGGHADPKNKAFNRGIISWQGDRRKKLDAYLDSQGVRGKGDDEELRAMARFLDKEMRESFPDEFTALKNAKSTSEASEALRRYIKYVPTAPYNSPDPDFVVKNNADWARRAKKLGLASGDSPVADFDFDSFAAQLLGETPPAPTAAPTSDFDFDTFERQILGSDKKGGTGPEKTFPVNAPMPELPATLEAQREAMHDPASSRAGILYTEGESVPPPDPATEVDIPLKGGRVLRANVEKLQQFILATGLQMEDIAAGKADLNLLIGGKAENVEDTANKTAVVTTDATTGEELVASAVTNDANVAREAQLQKAQFPNRQTRTEVTTSEGVTARRMPVAQTGEFTYTVGIGKKPEGVSNKEYVIERLMPVLAKRLGVDPSDVYRHLSKGLVDTWGTPLSDIQEGGDWTYQLTPEDEEAIVAAHVAKYAALDEQMRSGFFLKNSKELVDQWQEIMGIPSDSFRQYITGQAGNEEAYREANQNAELFERKKSQYQAEARPEDPPHLADWRARADMGWMSPDAVETERRIYNSQVKNAVRPREGNDPYSSATFARHGIAPKGLSKQEIEEITNRLAREKAEELVAMYGSLAEAVRVDKELAEKYRYRPYSALLQEPTVRALSAVPQAAAAILKSAPVVYDLFNYPIDKAAEYLLGANLDQFRGKPEENPAYRLGQIIDEATDSAKNKDFDKMFGPGKYALTVVPEAVGQIGVQIFAGMATGGSTLAATSLGMALGGSQQYDEAVRSGASREHALFAYLAGATLAAPEAILFRNWFRAISPEAKPGLIDRILKDVYRRFGAQYGDKAAAVYTKNFWEGFLKNGTKSGFFEGAQEVSENKGNDLVALLTYDPSEARYSNLTTWTEEDTASFVGGFAGGMVGGAVQTRYENLAAEEQEEVLMRATLYLQELLRKNSIAPEQAEAAEARIAAEAENVRRRKTEEVSEAEPASEPSESGEEFDFDKFEKEILAAPELEPREIEKGETLEPGTRVQTEDGEGVVVEDKGNAALVDTNPVEDKEGNVRYTGRKHVSKGKLQVLEPRETAEVQEPAPTLDEQPETEDKKPESEKPREIVARGAELEPREAPAVEDVTADESPKDVKSDISEEQVTESDTPSTVESDAVELVRRNPNLQRVRLIGSSVEKGIGGGQDVDLLFEFPEQAVKNSDDIVEMIESLDVGNTSEIWDKDLFVKVGDRYFHKSMGAGVEFVENSEYAQEQLAKPTRVLAENKPKAEKGGDAPQDKPSWQMPNVEYAASQIRKQGNENTARQILERGAFQKAFAAQHKKDIAAAIERGETIPDEVLEDYPEFKPGPRKLDTPVVFDTLKKNATIINRFRKKLAAKDFEFESLGDKRIKITATPGHVTAGGAEAALMTEAMKLEAERISKLSPRSRTADPSKHSLSIFVRNLGGIRPDRDDARKGRASGELQRISQKEGGLIGLVNKNSPYNAEDMAQRAYEAGYFPELASYDEISPEDFILAVEDDMKGRKRYSTENAAIQELNSDSESFEDAEYRHYLDKEVNWTKDNRVAPVLAKVQNNEEPTAEELQATIDAAIELGFNESFPQAFLDGLTDFAFDGPDAAGTKLFAQPEQEVGDSAEPEGEVDLSFDPAEFEDDPAQPDSETEPDPDLTFPKDLFGNPIQPQHQDTLLDIEQEQEGEALPPQSAEVKRLIDRLPEVSDDLSTAFREMVKAERAGIPFEQHRDQKTLDASMEMTPEQRELYDIITTDPSALIAKFRGNDKSKESDIPPLERPVTIGDLNSVRVTPKAFENLSREDKNRVLTLIEEAKSLNAQVPGLDLGPDQVARMSDRAKKQNSEAVQRRNDIVDEIRRLVAPASDRKLAKADRDEKKARDRITQIDREISDIRNLGEMSHTKSGDLRQKYQREVDRLAAERLALVSEYPTLATQGDVVSLKSALEPEEYEIYKQEVQGAIDGELDPRYQIELGEPGQILQKVGLSSQPLVIRAGIVTKSIRSKHNVPVEVVQNLPALLENPVLVFKSRAIPNAVVAVLDAIDAKGGPVIAAIHQDRVDGRFVLNLLASVYGTRTVSKFKGWLDDGLLLYGNTDLTPEWSTSVGLQLPLEVQSTWASNPRILTQDDLVKKTDEPDTLKDAIDPEAVMAEMRELPFAPFPELLTDPEAEVFGDRIHLNAKAHEIFRRVREEAKIRKGEIERGSKDAEDMFKAEFYRPAAVSESAAILREKAQEAKDLGYSDAEVAVFNDLADKLEQAAKAGEGTAVLYVFESALPHELFHQADELGAAGRSLLDRHSEPFKKELDNHDVRTILWKKHFSKFKTYRRLTKTPETLNAVLRAEIPPRLLELSDEELAELGITPEMRAGYLLTWFDGYADRNGLDALDRFDREELNVQEFLRRVREAEAARTEGRPRQNVGPRPPDEGRGGEQGDAARGAPESDRGSDTPSAGRPVKSAEEYTGGRNVRLEGETHRARKNEKRRKELELGVPDEERLAFLPITLRRAGIDADDLAYEVFGDRAAQDAAWAFIEDLGIEGAIKVLKRGENLDADKGFAFFLIERMLQDRADELQASDPDAAERLRKELRDLVESHVRISIGAGAFTRIPSVIPPSVELVNFTFQQLIAKKAQETGRERTVSPEQWAKWQSLGEQLEEAHAKVMAAVKAKRNVQAKIRRLEAKLAGKAPHKRRSKKGQAQRKTLVSLVKEAKQEQVNEIMARLKDRFAPDTLKAIIGMLGGENLDARIGTNFAANLRTAKVMAADGKDPRTIWTATGWEKDIDGNWKAELPDLSAFVSGEAVARLRGGEDLNLPDVLNFPALYRAYPQLADVEVMMRRFTRDGNAALDSTAFFVTGDGNPKIYINKNLKLSFADLEKTVRHEVQHAIQGIEGFAGGGTVESALELVGAEGLKARIKQEREDRARAMALPPQKAEKYISEIDQYLGETGELAEDTPDSFRRWVEQYKYDLYAALKGEVEARNVESRYLLPELDRRSVPLSMSEDVPRDRQIVTEPESLKSALEPDPDFPLDDFAEVGAMFLTEGLEREDYYPDDFRADMLAEFGDSISSHISDIYKRAWQVRNNWLNEVRRKRTKERVENKYAKGEELTADEIAEIIGDEKRKAAKKRFLTRYHELATGVKRRRPGMDEYERIILDIAPNKAAAVAAVAMAENVPPAGIYRRLKEMGVTDRAEQEQAYKDGAKVWNAAKRQYQAERDEIADQILRANKESKDIRQMQWEARRDLRKTQNEIADELKRVEESKIAFLGRQAYDATNAMRTMMASGDLSAALRQGGFFMFASPELQGKALADMFRSITEKGYAQVILDIEDQPLFGLAQRAGIDFAMAGTGERRVDITNKEEVFRGQDFLDKIPGFKQTIGKFVTKPSERTYTAFLDAQRMVMFDVFAKELQDRGLSIKDNPAEFRKIADFINVATGRGTLPRNRIGRLLMDLPLFAPRYTMSRLQLINMTLNPVAYANMPPASRKIIARKAARFYGTTIGAMGLLTMFGAAIGASVGWDPDDDDFLKVSIGNTKYDPLIGLGQPAKMLMKILWSGLRTDFSLNDRAPGEFFDDTGQAIGRFVRGKLAPLPGLAWDAVSGSDYIGDEFTWLGTKEEGYLNGAILRRLIPLTISDMREAYKLDGVVGVAKSTPFAIAGIGVSTYKPRPERPETEAEKLAARAAVWQLPSKREPRTPAEKRKWDMISDLKARARRGEWVLEDVDRLLRAGIISKDEAKEIKETKRKSLLVEKAEGLNLDYFEHVYRLATPKEREELFPILAEKMKNAQKEGKLDDEQRKRLEAMGGRPLGDVKIPPKVQSLLEQNEIPVPDIGKTLTVRKGDTRTLSFEQRDKYRKELLERIYSTLESLADDPDFAALPPARQKQIIEKRITRERNKERKETVRELRDN